MVLVLLVGGGLGWAVHVARVQRDAVAAIERAGGKAYYDWQLKTVVGPDYDDLASNNPNARPPWPKWFVDRIGSDYYSTVKLIVISGEADPVMPHVGRLRQLEEIDFMLGRNGTPYGPTDAGMAHLRGLDRLKHLRLGWATADGSVGSKITGAGLAAIAGATRMKLLHLQGIPLSDADLAVLRGMTGLRLLEIEGPGITDAGLAHLAGLVEMRELSLQGTRVTTAGIAQLRGMTRLSKLNLAQTRVDSLEPYRPLAGLRSLTLARTPITDPGLAPASALGFAGLIDLNLYRTRIGDDGLKHLPAIPKLKRLVLAGTDVTDAGVADFKKARPDVRVEVIDRALTKGAATVKSPARAGK